MELAEFVEGALVEIAAGVRNANRRLKEEFKLANGPYQLAPRADTKEYRSGVQFDVAVTATSSESSTGGGGVHISVLKAGVEASGERGEERVTRIKFEVSIESSVS